MNEGVSEVGDNPFGDAAFDFSFEGTLGEESAQFLSSCGSLAALPDNDANSNSYPQARDGVAWQEGRAPFLV